MAVAKSASASQPETRPGAGSREEVDLYHYEIKHAAASARTWIGRRLTDGDTWIAAGAPLVTHDRGFVGLNVPGLEVICCE